MMLSKDIKPEEQETYARIILTAGSTLLHSMNSVLQFVNLEHSKQQVHVGSVVEFDLKSLVKDVVEIVSLNASKKGILVKCKWNVLCSEVLLNGSDVDIRTVLLNLMSNAVKFTKKGSVELDIDVQQNCTTMKVTDTGIGIKKEFADHIFKPFSQQDNGIGREFGGSGLGLSICKLLVEAMKGTISFSSTFGQGTTFTVTIPLQHAQQLHADPQPIVPLVDDSSARVLNVLVVDDNPVNVKVICKMVESCGAKASFAFSGSDAIQMVQQDSFDLMFLVRYLSTLQIGCTNARNNWFTMCLKNCTTPWYQATAHLLAYWCRSL